MDLSRVAGFRPLSLSGCARLQISITALDSAARWGSNLKRLLTARAWSALNLSRLERALAAESSSLPSVCSVFEGSSDELDSAPDFVGFSSATSTSAGGSREACLGSFAADMAI